MMMVKMIKRRCDRNTSRKTLINENTSWKALIDENTSQKVLIDENTSRKASACAPVGLFGHSPPASLPFEHDDDHDYHY